MVTITPFTLPLLSLASRAAALGCRLVSTDLRETHCKLNSTEYILYTHKHNINTLTCRRYHLDESSASWLWDKDTLLELDGLLQQPSDVAYHSLKYNLSVMDSLDKTYFFKCTLTYSNDCFKIICHLKNKHIISGVVRKTYWQICQNI